MHDHRLHFKLNSPLEQQICFKARDDDQLVVRVCELPGRCGEPLCAFLV